MSDFLLLSITYLSNLGKEIIGVCIPLQGVYNFYMCQFFRSKMIMDEVRSLYVKHLLGKHSIFSSSHLVESVQ